MPFTLNANCVRDEDRGRGGVRFSHILLCCLMAQKFSAGGCSTEQDMDREDYRGFPTPTSSTWSTIARGPLQGGTRRQGQLLCLTNPAKKNTTLQSSAA